MARDYWFAFGNQPSTNTGLAPTFISFVNSAGQTIAPPSITETFVGTGLYKANYNATQTIAFVLDGATSGLVTADRYIFGVFDPADQFAPTLSAMNATLGAMGNTLAGIGVTLVAQGSTIVGMGSTITGMGNTLGGVGVTLTAQGATIVAIGNTLAGLGISMGGFLALVGDTTSTFGSTSSDPTTIFGFLKRAQECWEGDQVYTKASGILQFFSRGSGSSTLLRQKTVSDTTTNTTKS
jgi:hypothetical protein